MQANSSDIKKVARDALKGKWPQAIVVALILIAASSIVLCCKQLVTYALDIRPDQYNWGDILNIQGARDFDYFLVQVIFTIVSLLVTVPLSVGAARWFFITTSGRDADISEVFAYYTSMKRYLKVVGTTVYVFLKIFLWNLLLFAPGIICLAMSNNVLMSRFGVDFNNMQVLFVIGSVFLLLAGAVLSIVVMLRYFITYYIIIIDESLGIRETVKRAVGMAKGNKARFFTLMISFIGWALLCIFVVPIIYVYPYFMAASAVCVRFIMYEYGRRYKLKNQTQTDESSIQSPNDET